MSKISSIFLIVLLAAPSAAKADSVFKLPCYKKPKNADPIQSCSKAMGECERAETDFANNLESFLAQKIFVQYRLKRNLKMNVKPDELVKLSDEKISDLAPVMSSANVCVPTAKKFKLKNGFEMGDEIESNALKQNCGETFRFKYLGDKTVEVDTSNPYAREWSYLSGAKVLSMMTAVQKIKEEIKNEGAFKVPTACGPHFEKVALMSKQYENFLAKYEIHDLCNITSGLLESSCDTKKERGPASIDSVNDGEPRQCYMQMARNAYEHAVHVASDCALHHRAEKIYIERVVFDANKMNENVLVKLGKEIGKECENEIDVSLFASNEKIGKEIQKCYDRKLSNKIRTKFEELFPEIKDIKTTENQNEKPSLLMFAAVGGLLRRRKSKTETTLKFGFPSVLLMFLSACSGGKVWVNNPVCLHNGLPFEGTDFREDVRKDIQAAFSGGKIIPNIEKLKELEKNKWKPKADEINKRIGACCMVNSTEQKIASLENCGGKKASCVGRVGSDIPAECPGYVSKDGPPYGPPLGGLDQVFLASLDSAAGLMPVKVAKEPKRDFDTNFKGITTDDKNQNNKQAAIKGLSRAIAMNARTNTDEAESAHSNRLNVVNSGYRGAQGLMNANGVSGNQNSDGSNGNLDQFKSRSDSEESGAEENEFQSAYVDGSEYQRIGSGGQVAVGDTASTGYKFDFDTTNLFDSKNKRNDNNRYFNKDKRDDSDGRSPASVESGMSSEDYFLLSSSDDDLFKMVESRYRTKWNSLSMSKSFE